MQEKPPETLLGHSVDYPDQYSPALLQPIERRVGRETIGLRADEPLSFSGADDWTCYELSWLDMDGKPRVAIGELSIPCHSPRTVESKSLKLYLNSLNEHRFASVNELSEVIEKDLGVVCSAAVLVDIVSIEDFSKRGLSSFAGINLDEQTLQRVKSEPSPDFLLCLDDDEIIEETLFSHLFKSRCPVTNQPDWASVSIHYRGRPMVHAGVLAYLVSYRHHKAFHEQCLEQIFVDIQRRCQPQALTVIARFTRRGGIEINPWRSTENAAPKLMRQGRQ